MRNKISQRVKDLSFSGIRRFFDLVAQTEGVISLGVGEPDFVTPWRIREACIYSLEHGYTMYTSNYGLLELRQEIANYLERTYSVSYSPEGEILVTVGVSEALDLALRAIIDPGDEVIVPEPCYVSYKPCVILAGGLPRIVVTREEDEFKVEAKQIEKAVTGKTKALILSYPNNPTGATMSRKELEKIARLATKYDFFVISDEIYGELTYDGMHTCFTSLPEMRSRTILLNGFSKAFAMTGWRLGYAAAPAEIIEAMMKIHQYTMLCAPITAQMAAIEALRAGRKEVEKMRREYDRRRKFIVQGLNKIGLDCLEPKGAFYAFPSIRKTGLSSEEFSERLLKEELVAVVPGNVFGNCGEGYVRCSYANSIENINQALKRIEKFVKKVTREKGEKG